VRIADVCTRKVYSVSSAEPLLEAGHEMHRRHIGAVVVVEEHEGVMRPVGIVTDRDIVCGQVSRHTDLNCLTVADVMTPHPMTVQESSGIAEAIKFLSMRAVRRAPVINHAGALVGIVSMDDLLPILANELGALASLIGTQARHEPSV